MPDRITSVANPRIKELVRLRGRRQRDRTGRFLIEGATEVQRAIAAGVTIDALFHCEVFGSEPPDGAIPVDEAPFRKASYRDAPDGVLAVARRFPTELDRLTPGADALLLVVESIEKPGNLGAMLRTAAAAGVDGVIVCDPATDVFNPNVVRSSLGALFLVPVAVAEAAETRTWLEQAAIRPLPSSEHGTVPYWDTDLTGPVALVVGSEERGLSPEWLDGEVLLIPTPGPVSSLNAAMSAGILLFEARRQRA